MLLQVPCPAPSICLALGTEFPRIELSAPDLTNHQGWHSPVMVVPHRFVHFVHVCTCRVGQNVPERSSLFNTILVDSQQPVLQDDHDYPAVDDMQQQMFTLSVNPAYEVVPEHSQQPLQEDNQAYSNSDISQYEAVVTSGKPEHGTAFRAVASTK